jgi:hypothetical protein
MPRLDFLVPNSLIIPLPTECLYYQKEEKWGEGQYIKLIPTLCPADCPDMLLYGMMKR